MTHFLMILLPWLPGLHGLYPWELQALAFFNFFYQPSCYSSETSNQFTCQCFELVPSQRNRSSLVGLVLFPLEEMVTPVSLVPPVSCFLSRCMKPSTTGAFIRAKQMAATTLPCLQDAEPISLLCVKGPSLWYFIIASESNRMLQALMLSETCFCLSQVAKHLAPELPQFPQASKEKRIPD